MANYTKKITETSLRVGEVRFSYVHVFAPRKKEDGTDDKYGVMLLIPKTNKEAVAAINAAVEAAKQAGLNEKFGGKMPAPARLHTPLRDGDEEHPDEPAYEGMWFMNASSAKDRKPNVAIIENGKPVEALDENDFYSGCYGAATLNFFAYNTSGNVGIAAGLNGVIKTRDGEKLAGGQTMDQAFGDLAAELGSTASFLD